MFLSFIFETKGSSTGFGGEATGSGFASSTGADRGAFLAGGLNSYAPTLNDFMKGAELGFTVG